MLTKNQVTNKKKHAAAVIPTELRIPQLSATICNSHLEYSGWTVLDSPRGGESFRGQLPEDRNSILETPVVDATLIQRNADVSTVPKSNADFSGQLPAASSANVFPT